MPVLDNPEDCVESWSASQACDGKGCGVLQRPQPHLALSRRLAERLGHGGQQLSGGEQQMLTIGRALMTNPDVLILDEATEGLAPLIAREIWRICGLIRESGISSVIVDKNWKHVTQVTDRNVILVKGEVVFTGTSDELRAQPQLLDQYLGV